MSYINTIKALTFICLMLRISGQDNGSMLLLWGIGALVIVEAAIIIAALKNDY